MPPKADGGTKKKKSLFRGRSKSPKPSRSGNGRFDPKTPDELGALIPDNVRSEDSVGSGDLPAAEDVFKHVEKKHNMSDFNDGDEDDAERGIAPSQERGEERRLDPEGTGAYFTKDEFLDFYGGTNEWDVASPKEELEEKEPSSPPEDTGLAFPGGDSKSFTSWLGGASSKGKDVKASARKSLKEAEEFAKKAAIDPKWAAEQAAKKAAEESRRAAEKVARETQERLKKTLAESSSFIYDGLDKAAESEYAALQKKKSEANRRKSVKARSLKLSVDDRTRARDRIALKLNYLVGSLLFLMGSGSLFIYSIMAMRDSKGKHNTEEAARGTVFPMMCHLFSVSIFQVSKIYYEVSESEVGPLEVMKLTMRSRLWLFPGILGDIYETVRKSENMEKVQDLALEQGNSKVDDQNPDKEAVHRVFKFRDFLARVNYPETRILTLVRETKNWTAAVSGEMEDDEADALLVSAANDIYKCFPIMELMHMLTSLPVVLHLGNTLRVLQAIWQPHHQLYDVKAMFTKESRTLATRLEEFEVDDDTEPEIKKLTLDGTWPFPNQGRTEPMPWGTVRILNSQERFDMFRNYGNFVGISIFSIICVSYIVTIFSEVSFYTHVYEDHHHYMEDQRKDAWKDLLKQNETIPANVTKENIYVPPQEGWEEMRGVTSKRGLKITLFFLAIPYAIQVSALIAELIMMMLMSMGMMRLHVENFLVELEQFLVTLVMNGGSFADAIDDNKTPPEGDSRLFQGKKGMCRNLAFATRLDDFNKEITKDAETLNAGIFQLMVLMVCHIVPLNYFIYNPNICLPLWSLMVSTATTLSFFVIIAQGVKVNETMNDTVKSSLHDWQLKLAMTGWSGGFIEESGGEFKGRVPLGMERKMKDDEMSVLRDRLNYIHKVCTHYEGENNAPFKLFGLEITNDFITMLLGIGAGSIAGVVTKVIAELDTVDTYCFCHDHTGLA